jgi:hypothetical protein
MGAATGVADRATEEGAAIVSSQQHCNKTSRACARFRSTSAAAARELIEDLLGRGPIRDLIRLDDD